MKLFDESFSLKREQVLRRSEAMLDSGSLPAESAGGINNLLLMGI